MPEEMTKPAKRRERAGHQHRRPHDRMHRHTDEACHRRIGVDELQIEAEAAELGKPPDDQHEHKRER